MKQTLHGLLVIDKPGGLTSRAAVTRVQGWFPRGTRIGHAGTLDPLATGVLVCCLGQATRLTEYVQRMQKTYRAGLLLGARSDTDDAEGSITPVPGISVPTLDGINKHLQEFLGAIDQVPPDYSAAKVTGRRAYELARQGKEVDLQARTVQVHGIDVLAYSYPHLEIEVRCGKGTYVRSLARDLGDRLGCGALIETLRRTRIGPFRVEDAIGLDLPGETARGHLLPVAQAVADLPRLVLETSEIDRLRQGRRIPYDSNLGKEIQEFAVFDDNDALVAVANFDPVQQTLHATKVLRMDGT
jgi:tRNA pseudouridine55 synthase